MRAHRHARIIIQHPGCDVPASIVCRRRCRGDDKIPRHGVQLHMHKSIHPCMGMPSMHAHVNIPEVPRALYLRPGRCEQKIRFRALFHLRHFNAARINVFY